MNESPLYSEIFSLVQDFGGHTHGYAQKLILYRDRILIRQMVPKQEAILRYEQIKDIFYGKQSVLVTRKHNAFLRGLLGSMVAGETGAILGALSALPSTKQEDRLFLILRYTGSSGQDSALLFEDTRHWKGTKFVARLRELCRLPEPDEPNPKEIGPTML